MNQGMTEKKLPEISNQMDNLNKNIEQCSKAIGDLKQRITIVLSPVPSKIKPESNKLSGCSLAMDIHSCANRVLDLSEEIEGIIATVEL